MTNTGAYIILGFFITMLIIVLCVIFWPSKSSKIKKAFFKKMKTNPYGAKVIDNAPTGYIHDGEVIDETYMIRIAIKGNGLEYKGIKDGQIGLVDINCQTFEKGNIVLISDWTLWEIKTCRKNGDYTLTKEKDGKKITKRIKHEEIGGRLRYC